MIRELQEMQAIYSSVYTMLISSMYLHEFIVKETS